MNWLHTATLGLFASTCAVGAIAGKDKPNVLLILVDDLKPTLGAYGDDRAHSPNLDRLAERGTRFDLAYCNQAVCAPSRNNLLVGMRSTSLGIYGLSENFRIAEPGAETLPQYLRRYGYHAAAVGKVFHVGHGNTDDAASWSVPLHPEKVVDYALPESTGGKLTREEAYFSNQHLGAIRNLPRGAAWERADVPDEAYSDGRIAVEGIRRLRAYRETGQSFFLALGFTKPHLPFCAPEKYWAIYDEVEFPTPASADFPSGAPPYAGKPKHGELNQYVPVPKNPPMSASLRRTLTQGYYASMSYMDAQVGRVLDELKNLGMADNTVVVLWGDHGYHLGDHGVWTKHTNYEQANRIPLIFAGPGIRAGAVSEALVETVDIYPTIAALVGEPQLDTPQQLDGRSLAAILRGEEKSVRDHAYHAFPRGADRLGRALRTDRYRLVEWKRYSESTDDAVYELYDYVENPDETVNLASQRPAVVDQIKRMLAQHPPARPPLQSQTAARPPASAPGKR
ncbi:Choline-sulfatase [Pirellulimonas nuda]|uniref:Choline-sulfatase n=1 Tax=Pirellulimonas nuda TaxID=2528009 RepID=A0A518DDS5_9BACT|nr:sulfatase [Pirellulimonas nuda]QDU89630.1 Choline-sulfatase [Pirellulimonas nuda]